MMLPLGHIDETHASHKMATAPETLSFMKNFELKKLQTLIFMNVQFQKISFPLQLFLWNMSHCSLLAQHDLSHQNKNLGTFLKTFEMWQHISFSKQSKGANDA